jgi:hypothetical protein
MATTYGDYDRRDLRACLRMYLKSDAFDFAFVDNYQPALNFNFKLGPARVNQNDYTHSANCIVVDWFYQAHLAVFGDHSRDKVQNATMILFVPFPPGISTAWFC